MRGKWFAMLACTVLATSCTDPFEDTDAGPDVPDGAIVCTGAIGDYDDDGIPDDVEGCETGRDSDHDGMPDWQDFDADDDGILDEIEAGTQGQCEGKAPDAWPCDTDGDSIPDYLDIDSDGDKVLDEDEDENGDGLLGCCIVNCGQPDDKFQKDGCILNDDGCGPGQTCEGGKCTPPTGFKCSNGETSPKLQDTFGDGKFDSERGTFICRDATEDKPAGRKKIKEQTSAATSGDWHVALETSAKYNELNITSPKAKEAAGVIDHEDTQAEVAGFVVSLPATKSDIQAELQEVVNKLTSSPPGGVGSVFVRASGAQGKTHDRFDAVRGTILDVELSGSSNVSTVRNEVISTILGRSPGELGNLPAVYGSSSGNFVIRFVTVRRFAFKTEPDGKTLVLDADGYPVEDETRPEDLRVLVMGAVASRSNYQDPARVTGFIVDDLSNGTAIAVENDVVENECDVGEITSLPVADVIWVVDESGSMDDNREDIKNNAKNFFSRALANGLDFRMGVTNVCSDDDEFADVVGKFCSVSSTDDHHKGGPDVFLSPNEQQIFADCIVNPPGYEGYAEYGLLNAAEAVKRHLPRAANSASKIRPEAKTVIIVATDEIPESLYSIIDPDQEECQLTATAQAEVNQQLKPYLDLFKGLTDPQAAAMFHVIGGYCGSKCGPYGPDVAHGYRELAQQLGGQYADVCQKDLGQTLQVIIDSIVGAASPVRLEYVPISASLAVALDGEQVPRSRIDGFDYRAETNTLAFIKVQFEKGSEVVASYKRWTKQTVPQ